MSYKYVYIAASFAYEDKAKTSKRKYLIEKTVNRIKNTIASLNQNSDDEYLFYIPHQLKIPNAWDMSLEAWSEKVYHEDFIHLVDSDIVIFLSFGKENNAGSVYEVGYVCGTNDMLRSSNKEDKMKKLVVVKMTNELESLMISNSCDTIISEKDIESYDWINLPEFRTILEKLS